MSIQAQIDRLRTAKAALIVEIEAKGISVSSDASIDDLASLVKAISVGVDTSDATATARHIKRGKTAYVNGEKVTGCLYTDEVYTHGGVAMGLEWKDDGDGTYCGTMVKSLGDAEASDVVAGKKFTTDEGVAFVGTMIIPSITATDDGAGNVTIKMDNVSSAYSNGNVTLE